MNEGNKVPQLINWSESLKDHIKWCENETVKAMGVPSKFLGSHVMIPNDNSDSMTSEKFMLLANTVAEMLRNIEKMLVQNTGP